MKTKKFNINIYYDETQYTIVDAFTLDFKEFLNEYLKKIITKKSY